MKRISQIKKVILIGVAIHISPPNKRGVLCCPDNHDLVKKALQ